MNGDGLNNGKKVREIREKGFVSGKIAKSDQGL